MTAVAEPHGRKTKFMPWTEDSTTTQEQARHLMPPVQMAINAAGEPAGLREDAGTASEPLQEVALASARLERLQWEMDAAEEDLCEALRRASSSRVSGSALSQAAGLTPSELNGYLQRQPLAPADNNIQFW